MLHVVLINILHEASVIFAIMALAKDSSFVKVMGKSGSSEKPIVGYNAQGQEIREGDGGAIAYRSQSDAMNK